MLSLYLLNPTLILSVVVLGIGGGIFCLIGGEDQHHNTYLYGGSTLLHRPWRGPPRHKSCYVDDIRCADEARAESVGEGQQDSRRGGVMKERDAGSSQREHKQCSPCTYPSHSCY